MDVDGPTVHGVYVAALPSEYDCEYPRVEPKTFFIVRISWAQCRRGSSSYERRRGIRHRPMRSLPMAGVVKAADEDALAGSVGG